MMSPHNQAESGNGNPAARHHLVAEDRLSNECRQDLRSDSHGWYNDDVYLGMAEEPEEMLPEQWMAAGMFDDLCPHDQTSRHEETGSDQAVRQQQDAGAQQYRKHEQRDDRTCQHSPDVQR